jgi:hypothetical protein
MITMAEVIQEKESDSEWQELMNNDIRIKVVLEGQGDLAEVGTIVRCSYDCFILDNDTKERKGLVESVKDCNFKIGEGDCVPGFELALRHAREGRCMMVRCTSKFAYGFIGRPASGNHMEIPPNADMEYNVTKIEFVDNSALSPLEQAVEEVKLRKDCGNRWFASKDYPRAGRSYSKGIQVAEGASGMITEDLLPTAASGALHEAYLFCLNNLAATYICTSEYVKAKEICIRVLEMQPGNVKAILRAAKASLALDEYEECEACLNRVLQIDPSNPDALKEKLKLRKAQKLYRESSKRMATRMSKELFAASSSEPAPESEHPAASASPSLLDADPEIISPPAKDDLPVDNIPSEKESIAVEQTADLPATTAAAAAENTSTPAAPPAPLSIPASKSASPAKATKSISPSTSTTTATKMKTSSRKNTVLLLATSLIVVLMSVVVFFVVNQQSKTIP